MNHPWEACEVGAKARLSFDCPATQGVRPVLPLLVARGTRPGPLLLVIATQHGRELHGPAGIARLFDELDPAALVGTLVCLPVLNPAGIRMRQQYYPGEAFTYRDGMNVNWNMNRTWGLDHDCFSGTISSLVAKTFVDQADAVVDLHGWNSISTTWGPLDSRALILSFGLRINLLRPPTDNPIPGMLEGYVRDRAIPFMLAELAPQNSLCRERVAECHRGLRNVMRHLAMLPGRLELPAEQLLARTDNTETLMESPREGLCDPLVDQGDLVAAGQPLARLRDLDTLAVLEEFRAPHAGAISKMWPADELSGAVVRPGAPVVLVRADPEIIRN